MHKRKNDIFRIKKQTDDKYGADEDKFPRTMHTTNVLYQLCQVSNIHTFAGTGTSIDHDVATHCTAEHTIFDAVIDVDKRSLHSRTL